LRPNEVIRECIQEDHMATTPNKQSGAITIPEPFTLRDVLVFSIPGLIIFWVLFAFYFSLSSM
jgi:hypothetical protein